MQAFLSFLKDVPEDLSEALTKIKGTIYRKIIEESRYNQNRKDSKQGSAAFMVYSQTVGRHHKVKLADNLKDISD